MSSSLTPVWFITGASSGFGKAIALEALSRNHHVIATARSASKMEDLKKAGATTLDLDVTASEDVVASVIEKAVSIHGRLTHVVNAAGYVLEGTVEEASREEALSQFNTNVLGTIVVSKLAMPHLRNAPKTPTPTLSNFGSLGSWRSFPTVALYASTKWAVSGLTEGIRMELEPFGVKVTVIEPGYFRTEFLNSSGNRRQFTKAQLPVYRSTDAAKYRELLNSADNKQPGDVEKGARVVVDVLTGTGVGKGRDVPMRLVLGKDCVQAIREKMEQTEALLKEWEAVSTSTDHDDMN